MNIHNLTDHEVVLLINIALGYVDIEDNMMDDYSLEDLFQVDEE